MSIEGVRPEIAEKDPESVTEHNARQLKHVLGIIAQMRNELARQGQPFRLIWETTVLEKGEQVPARREIRVDEELLTMYDRVVANLYRGISRDTENAGEKRDEEGDLIIDYDEQGKVLADRILNDSKQEPAGDGILALKRAVSNDKLPRSMEDEDAQEEMQKCLARFLSLDLCFGRELKMIMLQEISLAIGEGEALKIHRELIDIGITSCLLDILQYGDIKTFQVASEMMGIWFGVKNGKLPEDFWKMTVPADFVHNQITYYLARRYCL